MPTLDLPSNDVLLASAAQFLIEGGDRDAANVLLSCSLEVLGIYWEDQNAEQQSVSFRLSGPRLAYNILSEERNPVRSTIIVAIMAVIPQDLLFGKLTAKAQLIDIDPEWRTELLAIARGRGMLNQAALAETPIRLWNSLKFRSQTEIRIAEALDRAGVLFLPNCAARLGSVGARRNREPDFLVCWDGKWGVLEVDGPLFHPPERRAQEQNQDRWFHNHGIKVVQHFDAKRCFEEADSVVAEFLGLLRRL